MEKKDLKPAGVFHYFEEICQVPRPSKKEEKIIAYLKAFGEKHKLETKVDEAGNVLIKKPATPGMENRKTVVLQSHIDMVCEKNNDVKHDFLTDPIETEIDGEWLKAKGTTLGADNGIGVATELAILADDSIEHGPIECLFTVDEETGLTGAFALKEGFMNGDILFADYMEKWLDIIKSSVAVPTFASYSTTVKKIVAPYFREKEVTLKNLTAKDIQEFYLSELERVSPSSVIHYHANIHKALKYAVKIDLIDVNPADKVERPKKDRYVGSFYDADEVNALFEAAKGSKLELPILFGAFYGLRRSEAIGLKWDAIDFDHHHHPSYGYFL